MMEPQPVIHEGIHPPPSVVRFTDRELELAHQMAALGVNWEPSPGMFIYDDEERFSGASPLQDHVFIILDYELFLHISGGIEPLRRRWTWLPTWEEGRNWLVARGKNDAEILDRVRERVVDMGLSLREALYELMVSTMRGETTEPDR